jgi:hypothetical protein
MTANELAERLTQMARELHDIRKSSTDAWVPEVKDRLRVLERDLLTAALDIEVY